MIRSLIRTLSAILITGAAITFVGCESDDSGDMATTQASASMGAINDTCPIMGGDIDPNAMMADFGGTKVGFCCGKCINKWNAWSDTQKRDYVAKSK